MIQPRIYAGVAVYTRICKHYGLHGANRLMVGHIEILRHTLIGPDDVITQYQAAAGLVEELRLL